MWLQVRECDGRFPRAGAGGGGGGGGDYTASIQQTPLSQSTSVLVNSSKFRHDMEPVLKLELEYLYVGLPNFHEPFFGDVLALDIVSEAVFLQCSKGETPLLRDGWAVWPAAAKEGQVQAWSGDIIPKLEAFAVDHNAPPVARRTTTSSTTKVRSSTSITPRSSSTKVSSISEVSSTTAGSTTDVTTMASSISKSTPSIVPCTGKWSNSTITSSAPSITTSTVYTTTVHIITKCPPFVTNCPDGGYVATETIPLYTAVCPAARKPFVGGLVTESCVRRDTDAEETPREERLWSLTV